jgi:hypothetical protein
VVMIRIEDPLLPIVVVSFQIQSWLHNCRIKARI